MHTEIGQPSRDRPSAALVFALVLSVYVLSYNGAFKSNDERALFSGADSFVKRGDFTVNQIYWDYTHVGMLTTAGDMVPNYEPAQMVLAIPFYVWGRALGAGVQGVMFFGAVVMAAAAAMVYLCMLELDYGPRPSLLATLVFAFATMAWPYSRTFFREPLTTLAYLAAVYGLLRCRLPAPGRLAWLSFTGLALGIALTTKQISVAIVPSLLLLAIVYERARPAPRSKRQYLLSAAALLTPVAACLLLSRLYTAITLGGVELFARDIVDYTTNPQLSQSVPVRMLRALLGLTISPYKGMFWYSPVLLLGVIGAIPFTRRHRCEGLAFGLIVVIHLVGYSRYNYWSGGVAWGSRYMLPVVPFLVLLAAPIWDWLAGSSTEKQGMPRTARLPLTVLLLLLIGTSAAVQLLGISIDLRTYELRFLLEQAEIWGGIGQGIEARYLDPAYSPVIGHLKLLLSGTQPPDFAWVQLRQEGSWALVPAGLGLSLALVATALAGFAVAWPKVLCRSGRRPVRGRALGIALVIVIGLGASALLTIYRQGDGRFDPYGVDRFLKPMMTALAEGARVEDSEGGHGADNVFLVPDPSLTDYFLNYLGAPLMWYALEPRPVDQALAQQLTSRYGRIWLGRDRNAEADEGEDRRRWERYLSEYAYKLDEQQYGGWARLLRFSAAGHAAETASREQSIGDMTLQDFTLGLEAVPGRPQGPGEPLDDGRVRAASGDTLQVGLHWRADRKPDANYTAFVQLLDPASQVRVQRDRWPGDGLYPTAGLEAGQVITDNLALPLDVPPGRYQLIAGLYRGDAEGLPRLVGPGGDFITLAEVNVEP